MKNKSLPLILAAAFLSQNLLATNARAEGPPAAPMTSEILDVNPATTPAPEPMKPTLVKAILSSATLPIGTAIQLQFMLASWMTQGLFLHPADQFGLVRTGLQFDILDVAEKDLSIVEKDILNLLLDMHKKDQLLPFIAGLLEIMKQDPAYAPMLNSVPAEKQLQQQALIMAMLDQTMSSTAALQAFNPRTWKEFSESLTLKLNRFDKNKPASTKLSEAAFMDELSDIANAKWVKTQGTKLLVDGEASFKVRDQLMSEAKESINMITWAVLDDKTGTELADLLIKLQKEKPELKIRLIVDGQISHRPGYGAQVKRLEENKIPVIRWINPQATFMGQHRKILIIDEKHVVMGGMNPGDTYSHKAGGDPKNLWRDTDVYYSGAAVETTHRLFAKIWNKQVSEQNLALKQMRSKISSTDSDDGEMLLVEHQPLAKGDQHEILLAHMKAIRAAEKSVEIENAYVIALPSLLTEIQAAVKRGVKVRILTNSTESVDEPIVALPIVRSAQKLADVGAEIYLKRGSTLHSKFMIVDGQLLLIGSYNLHPRSEKMEGETVAIFNNKSLAAEALRAFEDDVKPDKAMKLTPETYISIPINANTLLPLRMFYDQL